MLYNNLLLIISIVSLLVTALTVSAFTQSTEKQKEGINQTMQDISKSANQPIQKASQTTANETGEAVPIQKMLLTLEPTLQKEQKI
jgi:archaellum component FlaG (FlaF/FlaG flagellin family)